MKNYIIKFLSFGLLFCFLTGCDSDESLETTNPETTNPETTNPETTNPETTAPETTAPETTDPETTDPEITYPKSSVYEFYFFATNNGYTSTYDDWKEQTLNEEILFRMINEDIEWKFDEDTTWKELYQNDNLNETWYEEFVGSDLYEQYYTVEFVTNSNDKIETQIVLEGSVIVEPTLIRDGYTFAQWNDSILETKFDFDNKINNKTVLEAIWFIFEIENFNEFDNYYLLEVNNEISSLNITDYVTADLPWILTQNNTELNKEVNLEEGINYYYISNSYITYELRIKRLHMYEVTFEYTYSDDTIQSNNTIFVQENDFIENVDLFVEGYTYRVTSNYYEKIIINTKITVEYSVYVRPTIVESMIFLRYEGEEINLLSLDYAHNANSQTNGMYFVYLSNEDLNEDLLDITVVIKLGNETIVQYNYFDYNKEELWKDMPKDAETYGIYVRISLKPNENEPNGYIYNEINRNFTINKIDFDITDVTGNIYDDVESELTLGVEANQNISDEVIYLLDSLLINSYFNQILWVSGASYIENNNYEFSYEFSNDKGIFTGGNYTVKITLTADNYNSSSVTCAFYIKTLTTLEDGRALFNDGSGPSSIVNYYSGTTYLIDLTTNINFYKIAFLTVIISIESKGDTPSFKSTYNFNTATDEEVWDAMPKVAGEYRVTVELIETIGVKEYKTYTTTYVEVVDGSTNEIKENRVNTEFSLDSFSIEECTELSKKVYD